MRTMLRSCENFLLSRLIYLGAVHFINFLMVRIFRSIFLLEMLKRLKIDLEFDGRGSVFATDITRLVLLIESDS